MVQTAPRQSIHCCCLVTTHTISSFEAVSVLPRFCPPLIKIDLFFQVKSQLSQMAIGLLRMLHLDFSNGVVAKISNIVLFHQKIRSHPHNFFLLRRSLQRWFMSRNKCEKITFLIKSSNDAKVTVLSLCEPKFIKLAQKGFMVPPWHS